MSQWLKYTGYAVVMAMMFWAYQVYATDKSDLGILKILVLMAVSVAVIVLSRNNENSVDEEKPPIYISASELQEHMRAYGASAVKGVVDVGTLGIVPIASMQSLGNLEAESAVKI